MIDIKNPADCCGCTACASICAHDAITMKPDALGFLYPEVDKSKCVECGLCEKVCAFNDQYDKSDNVAPATYAGRNKNIEELRESRSGAVFIAFSNYILDNGGVVYGAGYTDYFRVVHKRATTKEERNEFKGSKYVQSDLTGIFKMVKDDLKAGRKVLFSGTPCQTAGLHSFIPKRLQEQLFLVDIVCHAVPSPYLWRDYLDYQEKKHKKRIVKTDFRDKTHGWYSNHLEKFTFADGTSLTDFGHRYFFYSGLSVRHSCAECKFCNMTRPSDISIGDFWGIENVAPAFNSDNKGVSLVIVNTDKGKRLLSGSESELNLLEVETSQVLQPNLIHPTPANPLRQKFEDDYKNKGYLYVLTRYGNVGWRYKMKTLKDKITRKLSLR